MFRNLVASVSLAALMATPAMAFFQDTIPTPNQLWNLPMIGQPRALAQGFTGQGFTIGVVDDVIDGNHPEFAGRWLGGVDVFGFPYIPTFFDFHGTHVAGTAAGANVGVAPGAALFGISIFNSSSIPALDANIGAGYRSGLERGVRAFNNSWGWMFTDPDGNRRSRTFADVDADFLIANHSGLLGAFLEVDRAGAIQVFSTGNSNWSQPGWMAALPFAIRELQPRWLAVMALGRDGQRAPYSNICGAAAPWCLAAPGGSGGFNPDEQVWSASTGGIYEGLSGTSMAAPAVTGALAVAGHIFPRATGAELTQLILQTATDIGDPGVDEVYGWGLLNVGNIVDTVNPKTAANFANASWARFATIGHAGSALRQRLMLPLGSNQGATSTAPLLSYAPISSYVTATASLRGGSIGVSNPVVSNIWAAPLLGRSSVGAGPASPGARSDTTGMLVGVDVISNSVARFGIAGGYSQTRLKTNGAADTGRSGAYHAGVYGSFNSNGWFAQGVGQVAIFDQTLHRLGISGAQGAAIVPAGRSSFRGSAFEADARFGYAFLIAGGATVAPYAAATARWQETSAFQETGAGVFSLDAPQSSQRQFAFGPGVRVSSAPMVIQSATLRVAADIAYARLTGDLRHDTNVTLLGRQIQGRTAAIGRDVLRIGGQLSLASQDEKLSGFIGYNGSFQQKAVSHVMSAGLNVRF